MPKSETKGRGRPTLLTKKLEQKLVRYIKAGLFLHEACALAKVSMGTVDEWIRRGEDRDANREWTQEHADFAASMRAAEAAVVLKGNKHWMAHFESDWRSIEAFQKRRFPHTWGNLVPTDSGQGELEFDLDEPAVVDPELEPGETAEADGTRETT